MYSFHYKFVLLLFPLGDIEHALKKIRKFVCSKLAFLEAFIEEGLKFSSSLYLMLIWIHIFKFVFENPTEVKKHSVLQQFPENANCQQLHRLLSEKYGWSKDHFNTRNTQS